MRLSYLSLSICIGFFLNAQAPPPQITEARGIPARATAGDYQSQAQAGSVTIAADFDGHSVPTPDAVYNTEDYVVVEAALFGAADTKLKLSDEDFTLRINGKKGALPAVSPEIVLRSLKDPTWAPPAPPEKSKTSIGGGSQPGEPPPVAPKMPIELQHTMAQRVLRAAILQGDRTLPQAGLLFFQFHGKRANIRSLELIYNGPAGSATLKLQP